VAATAVLLAGTVVAVLPFTATTNEAYTNRGYIWRMSLQAWSRDPLFGLGSNWYQAIGKYANLLPSTAFHGHNQVIQTLVVGGIVNLVLVVVMVLVLVVRASRWTRVPVLYPAVFLVMLFVSCALEVSFGFVDRGFLLSVTVIPVAFIAFATEPLPAGPVSEPARPRPRSLRPAPEPPARSTAAPGASTAGRSPQPLRR
jgi:O-antigen ligase